MTRSTQAIQTPPVSTEQILHSDKYFSAEAPVAVTLAGPDARTLGSGFANVYQQTMGELNIQVLAAGGEKPALDIPGLPADWPQPGGRGRLGWRSAEHVREPERPWLIDWQTSWDTQGDADEFSARIGELQSTFSGTTHVINGPQTVRIRDRLRPEPLPGIAVGLIGRAAGAERYIESGAEIPSKPSAAASVTRVASTSARRYADVCGSAASTTRRSR